MFKKLVVGALAAGIALTGGSGAASASTESAKLTTCGHSGITYYNGVYSQERFNFTDNFANTYQDSNGIKWYFKYSYYSSDCYGYFAHYEGRM
ncbi:hypothetical protein A6279_26865 [Bacillus wiedmannii]|uniref:Antimicrobial protein n=1 Tax=Bacillus wiedmannii TaxID=1890302 RepID=A0A1G6UTL4_9BACI|nr:LCI fold-containing protein [Bacillus wiedmannii]MED2839951.1 LCI family antimicrobial peptide [Bacillus wiedmannii]OAK05758.1 hypothetical protein A6278_27500 [Bacillus wiedmannii]OAK08481.1 hypothetical protein A6279_26865 [Bacillus wiedmannii]SDD43885.1 antimicrobial protein [Bacillus wiedmannii]